MNIGTARSSQSPSSFSSPLAERHGQGHHAPRPADGKRQRPPIKPGKVFTTPPQEVPGLGRGLPLSVYLPPDYETSGHRYPVAYMFDGQNLFDDHGSFAGGWHMHRALDIRASRGKVVPIVIGIHHGGETRKEELSPWPAEEGAEAHGDLLLDWVTGPLRTLVEKELRVSTHRCHRMIGGSSLGGLLALYGFFRHQDLFSRGLVMSPALWVQDGEIFYYVARAHAWGDLRLYLDCGGREAFGYAIQHAEWMADLLERKGFERGEQYLWRPDKRGGHNERSWRRRLPRALRYLYD